MKSLPAKLQRRATTIQDIVGCPYACRPAGSSFTRKALYDHCGREHYRCKTHHFTFLASNLSSHKKCDTAPIPYDPDVLRDWLKTGTAPKWDDTSDTESDSGNSSATDEAGSFAEFIQKADLGDWVHSHPLIQALLVGKFVFQPNDDHEIWERFGRYKEDRPQLKLEGFWMEGTDLRNLYVDLLAEMIGQETQSVSDAHHQDVHSFNL
jgi:hypothetical protein